MKIFTLTTVMFAGGSLVAGCISARPSADATGFASGAQHIAATWPWTDKLGHEISNLNRMRGHVRWLFRNYRSSRQLQRDFFDVSHNIDRINDQFRRGRFNRHELRRDVGRARSELYRIQSELRVKRRDRYRWR
jgi:hypothetical protein